MPLIYELTGLNFGIDIKSVTPYFTIIVATLLVSKIPTLALKKISISPKKLKVISFTRIEDVIKILFKEQG